MAPQYAMFKDSVVKVDASSCCQKVIGTCRGSNQRTCWWTLLVKKVIKLKKAFQAWSSQQSPEAADRYLEARRAAASAVAEAKTDMEAAWGGYGEDFQSASRKFWQTIQQLQKRKQGLAQAVFSQNCWPGLEMSLGCGSKSLKTVPTHLLQRRQRLKTSEEWLIHIPGRGCWGSQEAPQWPVPWGDEIHPEMLEALDTVGLSCLTHLFSSPFYTQKPHQRHIEGWQILHHL